MNFLNPVAFFLVILIPFIIIMYLLKLRRTEQVVSSTFLWQRIVRDIEANAPWQRLRRNLLLLLQLFFLLILILALVRPYTWAEGSSSQNTIQIFDTSASMSATDLGPDKPNRLERAKDQARLIITNLPKNARSTIITAGETTQVIISSSQDKRLLYKALEKVTPETGGSDMTSALELASAIANHQEDTEILIYSDGQVDLPERLSLHGHLRYNPVGNSDKNQAISLISLEPGVKEEYLTAFIQVVNYSAEPAQRRLLLHVDGQLIAVQDLNIPPNEQVNIINEMIPSGTEVLEAMLDGSDDLILDDKAWTVHHSAGVQKIALISQGNRFLETVLNLLPNINTNVIDLDLYQDNQLDDVSLEIFDKITPTNTDLPSTNQLFLAPISNSQIFSVTGKIENPSPALVSKNDSITKHLNFSQVSIMDSSRIPLPDWAHPVIIDEISEFPLLFTGEIEGKRLAVLTFDPNRSDLPLQVTYPILIANLMGWLLPGRLGDVPDQNIPGQAIKFSPSPGIKNLTVEQPDGSQSILAVKDGSAIFSDTGQLGVYRVTWGEDKSIAFAINLSNPQESNIQPLENLVLIDAYSTSQTDLPEKAYREWWRPLAAIALLIFVIEWLVYNRASVKKLGNRIFRKPHISS